MLHHDIKGSMAREGLRMPVVMFSAENIVSGYRMAIILIKHYVPDFKPHNSERRYCYFDGFYQHFEMLFCHFNGILGRRRDELDGLHQAS